VSGFKNTRLDLDSKIKFIDVGAANGLVCEHWFPFKECIDLVMFEPDKRSYKELKEAGALVFNTALGEKSEMRELYLARKPEVSSIYKPNRSFLDLFPNSERWDTLDVVPVELKSLNELEGEIGQVDFIKLDVQGAELDILRGSNCVLNDVLALEVEVEFLELYKGQPLFGDVCEYLSDHGIQFFDFVTLYRYGRKELNRKGQCVFADALFMRAPEDVVTRYTTGVWEIGKLKKYLLIAAVYKKHDLIEVVRDVLSEKKAVVEFCCDLLET
jgi:FkbM family methyltransferase